MWMKIRKANAADFDKVMEILQDGRAQLAERGIDQWQGDYPNPDHVKEDIANGYAYLAKADDGETVGTLTIIPAPDHFYDQLDGAWQIETDQYVTVLENFHYLVEIRCVCLSNLHPLAFFHYVNAVFGKIMPCI